MGNWEKESIKKLRRELRLTQVEFAKRLGCRQQTVSEWEQGIYIPANAYGKLLDFFSASNENKIKTEPRFHAQSKDQSQRQSYGQLQDDLPKRVTTFSLPKVHVPDIFREEIGIPVQGEDSDSRFKPFDPAVD
jgi:DNA-binding XRE family transcriptional regulator